MTVPVLDGNGSLVYFDASGSGTEIDPYIMKSPDSGAGAVRTNFTRRLDVVGDGSGNFNQNVDGSGTPVEFKIKPAPGEIMRLTRIIIFVQDGGSFDSDTWGNGIAMINGIGFNVTRGGVTEELAQFKVKTSGDMSSLCFDYDHVNHGAGDEYGVWRYTFEKAGYPIRLVGDDGDEYSMVINDDLSGLTHQFGTVQGHFE